MTQLRSAFAADAPIEPRGSDEWTSTSGILGPVDARSTGVGAASSLSTECLVETRPDASVDVVLRFLHSQDRRIERRTGDSFVAVDDLTVAGTHWLPWREAVEVELDLGPVPLSAFGTGTVVPVTVSGGVTTEPLGARGRIVRSRKPLTGEIVLSGEVLGTYTKLGVEVSNTGPPEPDRESAIRASFIETTLLLHAEHTRFSSLLEPPQPAVESARKCHQHRCFPVLTGERGSTDSILVSPTVLYDYPEEVHPEADGRDSVAPDDADGWWEADPASLVEPDPDVVVIDGVTVAKNSVVRVRRRRSGTPDLFFGGRTARVESIHEDARGDTWIGVVMLDDPAADIHGWSGRRLHLAPNEVEPARERRSGARGVTRELRVAQVRFDPLSPGGTGAPDRRSSSG
ncbi:hypothetical protein HQ346_21735 [Rhodococcus sp. BP-252]|uniref:hypothetical protein n=2 Tax=Rhodococcus TaxID=1827 RepID=UPI001C9A8424|nr:MULTISPECIES: hypothetical protein [unclassified Rhodococcus (in: high G+C Gram-positive bacteria)]MBY6412959.1 hypothetical protein [Rhodococcus sp. BP-320]MBY6419740.1 hypothetical protein [Rhodococcus sp. BP-321]MBY6423847.1 hypothetical protein [Rhodococcus sp. BP-324]MBY6429143.1 hypothetical protein [Rhodococcus sp. BP-323]MBY6432881.1 hypothetical protein [Rhodococcus sp. BP-322]